MLVQSDFELGLFQTSITAVAYMSATGLKQLRPCSDATYSDNLEVSANSVRSDLRSFWR